MTLLKKQNSKLLLFTFGFLINISVSKGAENSMLEKMSETIAETEILFKNCHFPPNKRDLQVDLFRSQKDMEYHYWKHVECNIEWEMGQVLLDIEKNKKFKNEPIQTQEDYDNTCDKRIRTVISSINQYLLKPLPQCESFQDSGI